MPCGSSCTPLSSFHVKDPTAAFYSEASGLSFRSASPPQESPSTFHSLMAASAPVLATLPSLIHTTPFTPSLCAFPALTLFPGLAKLHTCTFVSRLPLTAKLPSGLQSKHVTRAVCELQREVTTDQSAAEKTVMPPPAVPTARCEELGEKQREDAGEVRMSLMLLTGLSEEDIEKMWRLLLSPLTATKWPLGDDAMAVGKKPWVG